MGGRPIRFRTAGVFETRARFDFTCPSGVPDAVLVESGRERAERLLADRAGFSVDSDAWQEIAAAMDQPAKARPGLSRLFSRPRPE